MFKFTIREGMIVTLLAATCVAWFIDHRRLVLADRERTELRKQIEILQTEAKLSQAMIRASQSQQDASWKNLSTAREMNAKLQQQVRELSER